MDNNFNFTIDNSQSDMEYFDLHEEFISKFNHGVPTEMIPSHITKEEIMAAMKQCLEEGEDRLLEILNVKTNSDWLY